MRQNSHRNSRSNLIQLKDEKKVYNSGMKIDEQSSSLSHSICSQTYRCQNHSSQPASHYIQCDSQQLAFYCENCSVMLASKGFNVVKINREKINSNSKHKKQLKVATYRKDEIEQFIKSVQHCYVELSHKDDQLEKQLRVSQNMFSDIIEATNNFFAEIEQTIQLEKYLTYNKILNYRKDFESKMRNQKSHVKDTIEQLQKMGCDIVQNEEAVQTVDQEKYNQIMSEYQQKIQCALNLELLAIPNIEPVKFELPKPSDILRSVSEIIKIQFGYPQKVNLSNVEKKPPRKYSTPIQSVLQSLDEQQEGGYNYYEKSISQKNKQNNFKNENRKNLDSIKPKKIQKSYKTQNQNRCQEMCLRDSFSLTSINQNEQYKPNYNQKRQNTNNFSIKNLEKDKFLASQQSLGDYFMYDPENESLFQMKQSQSRQQTQTLLIQ